MTFVLDAKRLSGRLFNAGMTTQGGRGGPPGPLGLASAPDSYPLPIEFK
jgi:hypothetical protein